MHGPGIDEPVVRYEGANTTNKNWLYANQLGSVIATANSAGTSTSTLTYGPYGEPNQSTGVRFRYTGQQFLEQLNLYYYKTRMYSPALRRFLQTDLFGYANGMNLYAYVGNNPINRIDRTGLMFNNAGLAVKEVSGVIRNLIPGVSMMDNAQAQYSAGNTGIAAAMAVGAIIELCLLSQQAGHRSRQKELRILFLVLRRVLFQMAFREQPWEDPVPQMFL